jgi:hypothetical protein
LDVLQRFFGRTSLSSGEAPWKGVAASVDSDSADTTDAETVAETNLRELLAHQNHMVQTAQAIGDSGPWVGIAFVEPARDLARAA